MAHRMTAKNPEAVKLEPATFEVGALERLEVSSFSKMNS
jgi:hypothetical protein